MLGEDLGRGQPFLPFDRAEVDPFGRFPGLQCANAHALRLRKTLRGFGRMPLGIERHGFGGTQHFLQDRGLFGGQSLDEDRETTRGPERQDRAMGETVIRQKVFQQLSELRHGRVNHLPRQLFGPDFQQEGRGGETVSFGVFRRHWSLPSGL